MSFAPRERCAAQSWRRYSGRVDAQMVAPVNDTRTYFPVHSDPAEYRETPRSGVVRIGDECVRGAKDSWKVVIADEFSGE